MNICSYGCGQEATHQFKNGKWCCGFSKNQCPSVIEYNKIKNTGRKRLKSTKDKISKKLKGRIPWNKGKPGYHVNIDPETKRVMLEKRKKYPSPLKGKHHTEEAKNKISKGNKGKRRTTETKLKISNALKGIKFTIEHRKNMSISGKNKIFTKTHRENISKAVKGNKNGFYGKTHSTYNKLKISKANKGKVISKEQISKMIIKLKRLHKDPNSKYNSKETRDKHRKNMLNGGAAKANAGIKNPSKPQVELYNRVKDLFPSAVLNYPIIELNYSLDVAIPELKIWFESDGRYWHPNKGKEKDLKRQRKIEALGWRCIRYKADSIREVPSINIIKEDISKLL